MKVSRKKAKKFELFNIYESIFVLMSIILLFYRISIHADIYDEIINLSISYRVALGDIPFYNGWEAFQSGDIFMAPFLWLYIKIFNTTSGMILYSRLIYIGVFSILAIGFYRFFKLHLSQKAAFFLSYIIVFFEIYSLFYLWYDTVSIFFLCFGVLALLNSFEEGAKWKQIFMTISAGFLHCFMAFSYPAYIILAVIIAVIVFYTSFQGGGFKSALYKIMLYGGGALIFVSILIIYFQIYVGIEKIFETLSIITSSRSTNVFSILNILCDIFVSYVKVNKYLIPVTIILFIAYFASLRNPGKIKWFIWGLIILPGFNQFFIEKSTVMGLANYLSYLMIWCPFLYYMICNKKEIHKRIFAFLYYPSIASVICITLTTVYADIGPVKCWQASLPGALAALYFVVDLLSKPKQNISKSLILLLHLITAILLFNSYSYIYLNQPYITWENKRMTDGLYWGIKVNDYIEDIIHLQNIVIATSDNCETVLASSELRPVYMMTQMRPYVWSVEAPAYYMDGIFHWDYSITYFEYFDTYPDIMYLCDYEIADNVDILNILEDKYQLIDKAYIMEKNIFIYKKVSLVLPKKMSSKVNEKKNIICAKSNCSSEKGKVSCI